MITYGQGIICHKTILEYFLIASSRLLWFSEIVEKVRAYQLFAGYAGNVNRGIVHIRNFSFRANRKQWVQACLDQTPGVLRFLCYGLFHGSYFKSSV